MEIQPNDIARLLNFCYICFQISSRLQVLLKWAEYTTKRNKLVSWEKVFLGRKLRFCKNHLTLSVFKKKFVKTIQILAKHSKLFRPLIDCRENEQELTCHKRFQYAFTGSHAASCMHFQRQNHRFGIFEKGY
jgi:hypothetical protein